MGYAERKYRAAGVQALEPGARPDTLGDTGRTLAAAALGACVCVGAAALLVVAAAPNSAFSAALARLLPLPSVYSARASAALDRRPPDLDLARRENAAAVRAAPRQAELYLQQAYIAAHRGGGLGDEGRAALASAYRLAPLDHRLARWRIPFALDRWQELGPENRRKVLAETEVLWNSIDERRWLRTVPPGVRNPSGRLAIQLQVERLESASRAANGALRSH